MPTQRLFLLSPTVVFAARVNQADFEYPLGEVTFDTVTTGAYTAVKAGMTVLFGSAALTANKGRQRVRLDAAVNTLYIGRSSQGVRDGEVDLADNDYITVLDDYRVWAKIPAMESEVIYKDHDLAYTDQTDEIPPKANITGGAVAGTINSGTSLLTVTFSGAASYAVADGATISTYAWNVGDGTVTSGAGTATLTATFPAGFRWVSLTVTDSNGKTHITRVPVYARNPASDSTVSFQVVEHRITAEGQQCTFRILEDIPAGTYPDGTLVIFFEGEPSSATDRTNVKFWGWHQVDDNTVTAEMTATLRDVTLTCLDVAGRLDTLPGFPQSIEGNSAPNSWVKMKNPNMDRYIDYMLRWHSTAFELAYYTPSGTGSNYPFVILASDGESLFDQCQRRAGALVPAYVLTCNRNGELKVLVDPMVQAVADRTATSQVTIDGNDWTAASWQRQRPPRVHWLRGEAILASADVIAPVFNTSPGVAPGQGVSEYPSGEQLARSQTDLNITEGNRYAELNAFHGYLSLTLPDDDDRIQPANMTWVTVDLDGTYAARRGLGFSTARGLPVEVIVNYEYSPKGLVKTVELLWEEETSGTPAVTYIPPAPDWEPPWEPPPNPFPDPTPTGGGDGFGTNYVMYELDLIRTRAFSAVSPSWTAIKSTITDSYYDFILDPRDPIHKGFLLGDAGVYRSTDLDQVAPSFSLVLSLAEMQTAVSATGTLSQYYKICGTAKKNGFFAFGVWEDNGSTVCKVHVFVTTDGGDTWTPYTAYSTTGGGSQTRSVYWGAITISDSELVAGEPVIMVICGKDGSSRCLLSEDGGASWVQKASPVGSGNAEFNALHMPYNNNADSTKVLAGSFTPGTPTFTMWKSTDQGATWTGVSTSGTPDGTDKVRFNREPFQSWTKDYQELYAFGEGSGGGAFSGFYRSSDFGTTWDFVSYLTKSANGAGGFPYNSSQFYVVAENKILVSIDGGITWMNKIGNWAGATGVVSNCGAVIVPVWLQE